MRPTLSHQPLTSLSLMRHISRRRHLIGQRFPWRLGYQRPLINFDRQRRYNPTFLSNHWLLLYLLVRFVYDRLGLEVLQLRPKITDWFLEVDISRNVWRLASLLIGNLWWVFELSVAPCKLRLSDIHSGFRVIELRELRWRVLVCCHRSLHVSHILSFAFLINFRKDDVSLAFHLIFKRLTQLRRAILMSMMKAARSFFEWLFMSFSIRFNFDLCRFVLPARRRRVFCVFVVSVAGEEVFVRCNEGSVTVTVYIDTFSVHGEYNYFMVINKTTL